MYIIFAAYDSRNTPYFFRTANLVVSRWPLLLFALYVLAWWDGHHHMSITNDNFHMLIDFYQYLFCDQWIWGIFSVHHARDVPHARSNPPFWAVPWPSGDLLLYHCALRDCLFTQTHPSQGQL